MSRGEQSKLKLMVVDDEPDNLDLLYRTFRREFRVYKADSARGALSILEKEGEMAIIISDQRMPEMYGTEFLSQTVDRFPDTIRILLTGYTDVEDLVEAINSGQVFKYITKPWSPEALKSVVQQASETYNFSKQRTLSLRRALRRESLYNDVMSALRESLDYSSMLQTIAQTIGETFEAKGCHIRAVEDGHLSPEVFYYTPTQGESPEWLSDSESLMLAVLETRETKILQTLDQNNLIQIIIPLSYQFNLLAVLALYQESDANTWSDNDIQLLEAVSEQAALALSQARLYQRTVQLAEQMRSELEVARQIQTNLLRQSWPDLQTVKVQACCYPAREVGGDFFEVYVHSQGDVWVAVGDVSGKGVPAALFMASAMSVIRRELSQEASPDPEQVMHNLNRILADDLIANNYFITMVLARYTPTTGELIYANAGHIYPLVWSQKMLMEQAVDPDSSITVEPLFLKARGIPLGILPAWRGKIGNLILSPGDIFLLTSDGITEVMVAQPSTNEGQTHRTMLNQEGLWKLLMQQTEPLNLENLLASVREHSSIQEDDQTILALEVLLTDEN
ncbi:SpoIIE family protein phosphatase [Limnoraphis robusta]|uniref:SpoIIE family protein phosphatase n=1 Tax=Limnoraphis robusta CCNP1315 TaxID=3110306 RepID=A0ABU5U6X9_9CYAN|nr:SpoIIE family protein phosphatase [Limnoraphis robusta]MEA5522750.1 SpoIIE family protein phosphatase [Limnoraphis robusta CCNP1315]MEA5543792.1 SpoIIE family protein phosphatase [Limnoraphis robusta CCNP1324]